MDKIIIDLKNGDKLAAEWQPQYNGAQIAIGIIDGNGNWIQDLVVVETPGTEDRDIYRIYLYEDEYDECYTRCCKVNRIPENAL